MPRKKMGFENQPDRSGNIMGSLENVFIVLFVFGNLVWRHILWSFDEISESCSKIGSSDAYFAAN